MPAKHNHGHLAPATPTIADTPVNIPSTDSDTPWDNDDDDNDDDDDDDDNDNDNDNDYDDDDFAPDLCSIPML